MENDKNNQESGSVGTRCSVSSDAEWRTTYRRLRATAKQIRRGSPNRHAGELDMETEKGRLFAAIRKLQSRLEAVEDLQRMADSSLAKLASKLEPPDGFDTVAVFDSDGVCFFYENETTGEMIEVAWPFDREFIWPDDCEAAGIRVG